MRIVVALGGNALLRRDQPLELERQRRNVELAARSIAGIAEGHELVVTHGNGPQVGLLALQSQALAGTPDPLDVLGAESEGLIGYLLEQALENEMPGRPVATLLTQTVVDVDDPAFANPGKPLGPVYAEPEARALATAHGWSIAPDGAGYRRVVPSPAPRAIIELRAIELLLSAGVLVICSGGGGVPVGVDAAGVIHGVEAVVDKDLSAALLAQALNADLLLIATDVHGVIDAFGSVGGDLITRATPAELRGLDLPAGSMGPKAEACAGFVEATGKRAVIAAWDQLGGAIAGTHGTQVALAPPPRLQVLR